MKRSNIIRLSVFGTCLALSIAYTNCGNEVSFEEMPEIAKDSGTDQFSSNSDSSIVIEAGAEFTNQDLVQLKIYSPRAIEMKISNEADCSDGEWESYSEAKAWTLSGQNQNVSVYALFKSLKGDTSECISDAIMHDNVPPVLSFTSGENQITKNTRMDVVWEAKDEGSGIASSRCSDLNGQSGECENKYRVMSGVEGSNSVSVRLKDKAGNQSPIYNFNWIQDTVAPRVEFIQRPADVSGSSSAIIGFVVEDSNEGTSLCSINGSGFSNCSSPVALSNLKEGKNSLAVKAIDIAGNESAAAKLEWIVDLTAPNIEITSGPAAFTNSSQAQFAFQGTDDGKPITSFECRVGDGQAFQACRSPHQVNALASGQHKFEVRGVDQAGNKSAAVSYAWTIDKSAPSLQFIKVPNTFTNQVQASLQWQASDSDSGIAKVECSLNSGSFEVCPNFSKNLSGLSEKKHSFLVRATDKAGNQASITAQWIVDTKAPNVEIIAGPKSYESSFDASFDFLGSDNNGISHYECKLDSNAYSRCERPHEVKNQLPGGHEFYVRAIDVAGNVSAAKNLAWTIDNQAPIIRVISAPSALQNDEEAVVKFEVVDTGSKVDSVMCGLTSPTNQTSTCDSIATVNLGRLNAGNYIFLIYAQDKVGNVAREELAIEVTDRPLVCDPFSSGAEKLCDGGLIGDLFYLPEGLHKEFDEGSSSDKHVNYLIDNGTMVDVILNFKELNVPARRFDQGFPVKGGDLLVNDKGEKLEEFFAMRLESVLKLDPNEDLPGWYQLATISDDGSLVSYKTNPSDEFEVLVDNDGYHSPRMGCSSRAIYLDDASRIPLEVKYFQGPATRIAMSLIWRRVNKVDSPNDSACGRSGVDFGNGIASDWKIIGHTNMIAPPK